MKSIIENIETALKEKNISTYRLEKDTGISQQTFSKWRKGTKPNIEKIIIIAKYLNISIDKLVLGTEKENIEQKEVIYNIYKKLNNDDKLIVDTIFKKYKNNDTKSSTSAAGWENTTEPAEPRKKMIRWN